MSKKIPVHKCEYIVSMIDLYTMFMNGTSDASVRYNPYKKTPWHLSFIEFAKSVSNSYNSDQHQHRVYCIVNTYAKNHSFIITNEKYKEHEKLTYDHSEFINIMDIFLECIEVLKKKMIHLNETNVISLNGLYSLFNINDKDKPEFILNLYKLGVVDRIYSLPTCTPICKWKDLYIIISNYDKNIDLKIIMKICYNSYNDILKYYLKVFPEVLSKATDKKLMYNCVFNF